MIKCQKCGKELSKEDKFCPNCGTPIPEKTTNKKKKINSDDTIQHETNKYWKADLKNLQKNFIIELRLFV